MHTERPPTPDTEGPEAADPEASSARAVFEATPNPYLLLAPDAPAFTVVAVNDAYLRATMTRREDLVGRGLFDAFPDNPDDPAASGVRNLRASLLRVLAARAPDRMAVQKYDVRRPEARGGGFEERWWSPLNAPVLGPGGEVARIIHHVEDVTEREGAKAALRESQERLDPVEENAKDHAVLTVDGEGRITGWSPGAESIFGRSAAEIVGGPSALISTAEDRADGVPEREPSAARRDGRSSDERRHLRNDGGRALMNGSVRPTHGGDGAGRGFLDVARDEAERRRADAALRESEARFRRTADTAPALLWVTDADNRCTYLSRSWCEFTGQPPDGTAGLGWLDAVHPDDFERSEEVFLSAAGRREPFQLEHRLRGADGAYRWVIDAGRPHFDGAGEYLGFVGSATDIHERKEAEEALARQRAELERLVEERTAALLRSVEERRRAEDAARQAEKLAALGQLTGGVAHDFNNMLQVVASGAALLKRPAVPEARRAAILEGMIQAGQNARELTGRLLAFARRQPLKPETFDVAERLAGMSELLRQTLGPRVSVSTDITPGLWPVHADPSQLEVAVLNLAVNARDAMPDGGTLTIQARNVALSASAERAPGEYVCIAAKDTGEGIPPHLLSRVFEPFFTTKEAGTGTGLGLSQVHGFVTQSGGDIHVESEPGRGTTVVFHLPRAAAGGAALAEPADAPEAEGLSVLQGVGRSVLVVEDNPDVAAFACSLLEDLGYATVRAAGAAEAMALLAASARVDAVFSDVVMPGGASGVELAAALRSSHPRLAVVLATGYSEVLAQSGAPEGVETLRKPYRLDELAVALARALARSAARLETAG